MVENAGSAHKEGSAGISCAPETVALKHTFLVQTLIAKKSKIDTDLQDLNRYLTEKKSTAAAARVIVGHQETTDAAEQKLKMAERTAVAARRKLKLASGDSDIANIDLNLAAEEIKGAEESMLFAKAHRPYQRTEEGF